MTGPTGFISISGTNYGDYVYWNTNTNAWAVGSQQVVQGGNAGKMSQNAYAVAVGFYAGFTGQGTGSVAVGAFAGMTGQGANAVAIGYQAAQGYQGTNSVAIGYQAGFTGQNANSVAIGYQAGYTGQGTGSIAIGYQAGFQDATGPNSIAIGTQAGQYGLGSNSIAIGNLAGPTGAAYNNTIVLNASGTGLSPNTGSAFYVAPIRNAVETQMADVSSVLFYNTTTSEITYASRSVVLPTIQPSYPNVTIPILFAAGAGTNTLSYSTNLGTTWTGMGTTLVSTLAPVIGANGIYWITPHPVFRYNINRSTTPTILSSWSLNNTVGTGGGTTAIVWNSYLSLWFNCQYSKIYTSPDAITWTLRTLPATSIGYANSIAYDRIYTVLACDPVSINLPATNILWTTDGITYSRPSGSNLFLGTGQAIATDEIGNWAIGGVAGSGTLSNTLGYASDGPTGAWTADGSGIFTTACYGMAYGNGVWVAGGTGLLGTLAYSIVSPPTRTTWRLISNGPFDPSGTCNSVIWTGSIFIAAGTNIGATVAIVATSPNGSTWTTVTAPSMTTINTLSYSGGDFNFQSYADSIGTLGSTSNYWNNIYTNDIIYRGNSLHIGYEAGYTGQNSYTTALGYQAGYSRQGSNAIAIGYQAGFTGQNANSVAIGYQAGFTGQGTNAIALGNNAGYAAQGIASVGIGRLAGSSNQGDGSIALGFQAGYINQGNNIATPNSIAIGYQAAQSYQGAGAISLGYQAGLLFQGTNAIAIGYQAGYTGQKDNSIAIGYQAGFTGHGTGSIAIGYQAGLRDAIGPNSIAIGTEAGEFGLGSNSIAIGYLAGPTGAAYNNNIILNAGGTGLSPNTGSAFYAAPIRNSFIGTTVANDLSNVMFYNQITNEITYAPTSRALNAPQLAYYKSASTTSLVSNTTTTIKYDAIDTSNTSLNSVGLSYSASTGLFTNTSSISTLVLSVYGTTQYLKSGTGNAIIIQYIQITGDTTAYGSIQDTIITGGGPTSVVSWSFITIGPNGSFGLYVDPPSFSGSLLYIGGTQTTSATRIYITSLVSNVPTGNKTFIIDHPTDSARHLIHACLEGPEVGVYYRGEGSISSNEMYTTIYLPRYVDQFATDYTVQITSIYTPGSTIGTYASSRVIQGVFQVYGPPGSFYWHVHGKRGSIDVEPLKSAVTVRGEGPYKWITQ